jgi:hypothetical protein
MAINRELTAKQTENLGFSAQSWRDSGREDGKDMHDDPTGGEQGRKLRRIQRNPMLSNLLNIYSSVGRETKANIKDATTLDNFVADARDALQKSVGNDAMLYGHRTQAMFEAVAVSLGKIRLIRLEDASDGWFSGDDLQVPDFRIITTDNKQMLVEVKNCHADVMGELSFKTNYIGGLRGYGKLTRVPVKVAVFWSKLGIWTLNQLEDMQRVGERFVLTQKRAMFANQMSLLGDYMVGTRYPLRAEFIADETRERSYNKETGLVSITIGRIRLSCAGVEIADERERSLAFMFMLYGYWNEDRQVDFDENAQPRAILYEFAPEDEDPDQKFAIIASIGEMSSKMFRVRTQEDTEVTQVSADLAPAFWDSLMPYDAHGQTLPLWRFVIRPNRRGGKTKKKKRR